MVYAGNAKTCHTYARVMRSTLKWGLRVSFAPRFGANWTAPRNTPLWKQSRTTLDVTASSRDQPVLQHGKLRQVNCLNRLMCPTGRVRVLLSLGLAYSPLCKLIWFVETPGSFRDRRGPWAEKFPHIRGGRTCARLLPREGHFRGCSAFPRGLDTPATFWTVRL